MCLLQWKRLVFSSENERIIGKLKVEVGKNLKLRCWAVVLYVTLFEVVAVEFILVVV